MGDGLKLAYATHSEIGLVRKNNQDSGYASPHLLAVADGMGGAAAGDLASAVAIHIVRKADRDEPVAGDDMLELLVGALDQANEKIADLVADDPMLDGMGTTFTGALFDGHQLGLVHIGDSRAYLLRDKELTRLTHDHSWVQSLIDEGKISEEEAAYHPHRSLLLKVLNGQPANDPDSGLVDVQARDRLLLCSDGLCGLVEDPLIHDIMQRHDDLDGVMRELVEEAHHEGGIDNITIVLADVVETTGDTTFTPLVIGAADEREVPNVGPRDTSLRPAPASTEDAPVPDAPEPTGPTSGASPVTSDEEQERYAPRLAPRRPLWRGLLIGVLAMLLAGGALYAGYRWSRTQYFVGASHGNVTIFTGLHQEVLGTPLYDVVEVEPTRVDDLPQHLRQRVDQSINAAGLDDARRVTGELRTAADECIRVREARNQPPTTAPTPPGPTDPNAPVDPNAPPSPTPTPAATPDPGGAC